jgi:preprotein translocase SecE subunit
MARSVEKFLVRLEEQGWFHAIAYKPQQGLRVRRGTIFGLLLIVVSGIYTLLSHGTLTKAGSKNWQINIPFTSRMLITDAGDTSAELKSMVDLETFQQINNSVDGSTHVKIFLAHESVKFKVGQVVERSAFNEEVKALNEAGQKPPEGVAPRPASGDVSSQAIVLLPSIQYTVPLLLLGVCLWLSWRIVNMPVFADFLIATEAEMNKVSWATQRRLYQDTVVVLITVVLMAGYLFSMDQVWRVILSWRPIGVLQIPEDQTEQNTAVENKPW